MSLSGCFCPDCCAEERAGPLGARCWHRAPAPVDIEPEAFGRDRALDMASEAVLSCYTCWDRAMWRQEGARGEVLVCAFGSARIGKA